MDWPAVTAIAAIATAVATAITAILAIWRSIRRPVLAWRKRNALYKILSEYEHDILKAFHDSETTQVSGGYDDTGIPHISTMLECVPGAPIACRLKASEHYLPILHRLAAVYGFLKENTPLDTPLRYDPSKRHLKAYHLTPEGKQFIHKYAVGRHRIEKFIRRWFKGLCKHKYEERRYCDSVGAYARRKLPKLLRGTAWLKKYDPGANLGMSANMYPIIYEYPIRARQDGVECMVEIPLSNLDAGENNQVFLAIHASNKPRYLKFNPKVAESSGDYWIQAKVISIKENNNPEGTVINLGNAKPFDPDL